MGLTRCIFAGVLMAALLLAVSRSCEASGVDVPVALHGTEQWAGVVAKAVTWGGKDQAQSLQDFEAFQSRAMSALQRKAVKLEKGDFSNLLKAALTNAVQIDAPVFFDDSPSVLSSDVSAISFGFSLFQWAPCAVPITPLGVGIFPQAINIQPQIFNIAPTGVNIQPQGANIGPQLIVIGPYDTTVAGQGLNIAPALIVVAPTREIVNPVGPLAISDTLIEDEVPALP